MKARIPAAARISTPNKKIVEEVCKGAISEQFEEIGLALDAAVLYILHEEYGWGKERLRKFFALFQTVPKALEKQFHMPGEFVWLAKEMLRRDGIDVDAWNAEEQSIKIDFEDKIRRLPWYERPED